MEGKKVLIVTYYWPPAGGPGVQRWLKFVKYLPEFNIAPIVYCPSNPNYPIVDESLVNELQNDIITLQQPINEPYRFAKLLSKKSSKTISSGVIPEKSNQSLLERLMLFIRGNFFIPDARRNWIKPSVRFLSNYIENNNIDTIITTGPPHSMHLIGLKLKQTLSIKWIADFRDPWTTIGYHKSLKLLNFAKKKHIKLEQEVLNSADQIVVTSNHTMNEFSSKTNQPIEVITNGYDSHSAVIKEKDSKFTLSHIGSLLSDRNPIILWEVLSELIEENRDFAVQFQLNLVGVVSNSIVNSIKKSGLEDYLNLVGYVSHKEARAYQKNSQLLLLIEIDSENTKAIIPGKLFEYMVSETPILAIGPKDSDIEQVITSTNTGNYFCYDDKQLLKTQILDYFDTYKEGALKTNGIGLEKYSRRSLSQSLSKLLVDL
ncbi:glycosyltransferase [Winogradskyella haliclonae]|uniref:Glycosyl transferase family 1 n=1 Tax=Winogradskyella haliclonae TaxID=2048558 RepID=A0ABQ2BYH6_9FLAO|nr:glycosyltransferase [Winogradskyella haliclonae]GGI57540.1 glycosyl transferase family 1 [Winogradskyella haliclonae]